MEALRNLYYAAPAFHRPFQSTLVWGQLNGLACKNGIFSRLIQLSCCFFGTLPITSGLHCIRQIWPLQEGVVHSFSNERSTWLLQSPQRGILAGRVSLMPQLPE